MAFDTYNQQDHDFVCELRKRIAGTDDEHAAVRKVQEIVKDASFDEVRDAFLRVAKGSLLVNPALASNPASELAAMDDEQIYKVLQGAVEYGRVKAQNEGIGR